MITKMAKDDFIRILAKINPSLEIVTGIEIYRVYIFIEYKYQEGYKGNYKMIL